MAAAQAPVQVERGRKGERLARRSGKRQQGVCDTGLVGSVLSRTEEDNQEQSRRKLDSLGRRGCPGAGWLRCPPDALASSAIIHGLVGKVRLFILERVLKAD